MCEVKSYRQPIGLGFGFLDLFMCLLICFATWNREMEADLQSLKKNGSRYQERDRDSQQRKSPDHIYVSNSSLFSDSAALLP